jgi:hypothetical protein
MKQPTTTINPSSRHPETKFFVNLPKLGPCLDKKCHANIEMDASKVNSIVEISTMSF